MKFIRLTSPLGDDLFVRPELIGAFGPSKQMPPPRKQDEHKSFIWIHGDQRDLYVRETCAEIEALLENR